MLKSSSRLRSFLLALVALALVVACAKPPSSSKSPPLISATNTWVGLAGQHVAVGKNFFSDEGLNVKDLLFQTDTEEMTAFMAKKIDLAWLTSGSAIQMAAKNPSIKIVYLVDYSNGSDGIVGRDIPSPQVAKGKIVGRENILFEKVLLRAYLQKGGLTEKDVVVKDMAASDAAAAFGAKHVDLAVTYEPYLTIAAKQGKGDIIFTTKDTNLIADVIVARESLIKSRKADLQAYFRAVDKAVKLLNANDSEALSMTGRKLGVKPGEVKTQLKGATLFDLDENKAIAFDKNNPKSVIGNLELTSNAAYDFKMIPAPLKVESLYDDSVIKST
jgi:NitT/TauT family transport system substrate-binding protein